MKEIESVRFQKVERSYFINQPGWRLATFEEARNGLDKIEEARNGLDKILGRWDRVRLLDGWILGSGYDYKMGNNFKGCLGYMLLIQTRVGITGFPYADVNLSELGKEVALFLCVDDWNYEVVYWLLNCWSKSEIMNLRDVRGGNIPFPTKTAYVKAAKFKNLNEMLSRLARELGEKGGVALEKAEGRKYDGKGSVKDVLSGMIKILTEEKDIVEFIGNGIWHFRSWEGDEYLRPPTSVETGHDADAYWSFVCDTFAGYVVEVCALESLLQIRQMNTNYSKSEKNFTIATDILLYLSDYRSDIIHEPLAHECLGSCAGKIMSYAAEKAAGNPHCFSEILKGNAMWMCYDEMGHYGILDKLLFIAKFKRADAEEMLVKCGAQPGRLYAIGMCRLEATHGKDEDLDTEIGRALLTRCDVKSQNNFVNARDEKERTVLHSASENMNPSLCKLLIEFGASVKAQDQNGMTPLHYALEGERTEKFTELGKVVNVLMESQQAVESLCLTDKRGSTPLDIAVAKDDNPVIAILLSKYKEPEAYFDRVDEKQLLRSSLLLGSVDIVRKLFDDGIPLPAGDCDNEGKTAFHLAALCDDESSAVDIISLIKIEDMVAKQDRRGRTALHEAALKGHLKVCELLLDRDPRLIYTKDREGRNPLYDAVKSECNGTDLHVRLFSAYLEIVKFQKDLMDRKGLTPLHVAASHGKAQVVTRILSEYKVKENYLSRGDFMAQTALHKAAKRGDVEMMKILLHHGAHPLRERDNEGKTALHYAVQAEKGNKQEMVCMLLGQCDSDEEKSLLLWAPAAGLGSADQALGKNNPLRIFLEDKKTKIQEKTGKVENLLQMAASRGYTEMTKELISKGYKIRDIQDDNWRNKLDKGKKENVTRVLKQIEMIKEQGNDKPVISDCLGRLDYAQALAALFLNPYIKPPIAVGITGSWGAGKSSLMLQTERILLTTSVQMALLESSKLTSSTSEFPDVERYKLSKKGNRTLEHTYRHLKNGTGANRNKFVILRDNIWGRVKESGMEDELEKVLNKYESKHRKVIKTLAAMDSSNMFETNVPTSKADQSANESVPAILTVQYNAWKYKNDTEALAGLAVEVTHELEGIMTQSQWLNTCWRNACRRKKYTLWIEIFFPSLLALVLVSSLTWIVWVVFDSDKLKAWSKAKYGWPPVAIFSVVWTVTKSVMGILKPISAQLMQYISFPDHTDKLGYQDRVISDITFLKDEIGKKASWVFIVIAWYINVLTMLWRLITGSWVTFLSFDHRRPERDIDAPTIAPASGNNLRIVVFVDDLDRCQDSVILQVLSAINLILAVCEINVVMGMEKRLIQRAIMKKHGNSKMNRSLKASEELADLYLQKIVQLQLDLPEPSDEELARFLKDQLGVSENDNKDIGKYGMSSSTSDSTSAGHGSSSSGGPSSSYGEIEAAGQDHVGSSSSYGETEGAGQDDVGPSSSYGDFTEAAGQDHVGPSSGGQAHVGIDVQPNLGNTKSGPTTLSDGAETIHGGQQNPRSSILKREVLFVRYSKGEEDAILHFQRLATGCRKLPREWKRLLNYHRLVWYIFSLGTEAKNLEGWQVQLITWIFICWEWQDNMNLVIEKWKEIVDLKISDSNDPTLLMIVEYLIDEHEREIPTTNHDKDRPKMKEKLEETRGNVVEANIKEGTESGRTVHEKLDGKVAGKIPESARGEEDIARIDMNAKYDALEKSLAELKKEMKEIKELVSDGLMNDIKELKKQVSEELKKDRNEIKEQMVRKQNGKKEEKIESKKLQLQNLANWKRMKKTLERYDVTMDGIQAFQRFRFYCIAGYLPRPAPEETYRAVFGHEERAFFGPRGEGHDEVWYVWQEEDPNTCCIM